MARIGGAHERAPCQWLETKLFHHSAHPFLVHFLATALQLASDAAIAVAGELFVNAFDLLPQLVVVGIPLATMLCVGFVVKVTGGKPRYLADFRNRSQFLAVITDVSALFFR
jgi:hypothetical protein